MKISLAISLACGFILPGIMLAILGAAAAATYVMLWIICGISSIMMIHALNHAPDLDENKVRFQLGLLSFVISNTILVVAATYYNLTH